MTKKGSRPRLNECDEFAGEHVRFVLGPLLGRQLAFVALARQPQNSSLHLPAGAVAEELSRIVDGQAPGDRFQDFIEDRPCRRSSHANSIPGDLKRDNEKPSVSRR